jgi:hypothetical protein
MADKTGAFNYVAVFTAKDPVIVAGYGVEWSSEDNIVGHPWHGDCLCQVPECELDAGDELVLYVDGSLKNPSEDGTVGVWFAFCNIGSFWATTTVVPWVSPWVSIETVTVGNPGNTGENSGESEPGGGGPDRICGAVDYVYNIGTFEVTAGQYAQFLRAVAGTEDTYGLYNTGMWCYWFGCRIERTGSSPNYSYSVAPDWADRPVNYVSWGDAARFANWLHNGQPTGAQDLTTTEDGSYYLNGATSNAELLAVVREPDACWPSCVNPTPRG